MPPLQKTTNTNEPQEQPSMPMSRMALLGSFALVSVALVAVLIYWVGFREVLPASEPTIIGMIGIPQVKEADEGFKEKLAELGYENTTYLEHIFVPGPELVAQSTLAIQEMIEKNVDIIFTDFEIQAKIALKMTKEQGRTDIPIVFMTRLHDPVGYGLIGSFQSSGNNATGVATNIIELIERHLGFIKEIRPEAKKLGIFANGFQIPSLADEYYAKVKEQAPRFGMEIVEYTTDQPPPKAKEEFDRIAATIQKGDIDALMHIAGHYYVTQEAGESQLAIRLGIPMATNYEDIPRGGHFTYSNGTRESGKQAAVMTDKIFKGAKPSDIPIEYAQRGILSIHLGRAEEAGFAFPESMIFIAENRYEDDSLFPPFTDH